MGARLKTLTEGGIVSEPNRELDAQIAEKVMGLKIRFECPTLPQLRVEGGWLAPDDYLLLNDDGSVKTGIALPGGPIRIAVPHYSSDISAAMEVTEKMIAAGWWAGMGKDDELSDKEWYAEFYRRRVTQRGWAEAETLAEAICLAALKSIGVRE